MKGANIIRLILLLGAVSMVSQGNASTVKEEGATRSKNILETCNEVWTGKNKNFPRRFDSSLIAELQDSKSEVWSRFVQAHTWFIRAIVTAKLSKTFHAEFDDVVQDVWIRFMRFTHNLKEDFEIYGVLRRLTERAVTDFLRSWGCRQKRVDTIGEIFWDDVTEVEDSEFDTGRQIDRILGLLQTVSYPEGAVVDFLVKNLILFTPEELFTFEGFFIYELTVVQIRDSITAQHLRSNPTSTPVNRNYVISRKFSILAKLRAAANESGLKGLKFNPTIALKLLRERWKTLDRLVEAPPPDPI